MLMTEKEILTEASTRIEKHRKGKATI